MALCAEAICCTCFLSLVSVSSVPAENVNMYMSHGWVALLVLYFPKFMCVNESSRFKFLSELRGEVLLNIVYHTLFLQILESSGKRQKNIAESLVQPGPHNEFQARQAAE